MHQQFYYAVPKTGCEKLAWATNSDWRLSELTPTLCKNQRSKAGLLAPLPFSGIVFHCMWRPVGEIASTLVTPVICNHNCPPTGCKNGCSGLWLRWNERAEWEQRIEGVFYESRGGGALATWHYCGDTIFIDFYCLYQQWSYPNTPNKNMFMHMTQMYMHIFLQAVTGFHPAFKIVTRKLLDYRTVMI